MAPPAGLGPLEMRILGLLDPAEGLSVQQVQSKLANDGYAAAYTTVMTVLGRLHEKGVLVRIKDGNRYLYSPAQQSAGIKNGILERVQRMLWPTERAQAVATLLADDELGESELKALRALIDQRLADKGR